MTSLDRINSKAREIGALILLVSIAGTVFLWLFLMVVVVDGSKGLSELQAHLMGPDKPEYLQGLKLGLSTFSPQALMRATGGARFWVLVAAAGIATYLLRKPALHWERDQTRWLHAGLLLLPAIVGLGMVPGLILHGFQVLAQNGVGSPRIMGAIVGESFAPALVGLALGSAAAVALYLQKVARTSPTDESGQQAS